MSYETGAICLGAVAVLVAIFVAVSARQQAQEERVIRQMFAALSPLPFSVDEWTPEQRETVRRVIALDGLPMFHQSTNSMGSDSPQRRFMEWETRKVFLKNGTHPAFVRVELRDTTPTFVGSNNLMGEKP
jgi:hypothetical protein